jgi:serine protease inhibitor ecotin
MHYPKQQCGMKRQVEKGSEAVREITLKSKLKSTAAAKPAKDPSLVFLGLKTGASFLFPQIFPTK